jgi:SAM-dependent methyltransferase
MGQREPTSFTPFPKYEHGGAYHWGKLSGRGPRSYHARLRARYGWFVKWAHRRSPGLIVDVGCGDAALTHLLAMATEARVVGIEPDPDGVEAARRTLTAVGSPAEVRLGFGERLPFADDSVARVVLCEVIEHVEDTQSLIRESARVLAPDGCVLLSTPQRQEGHPLHPFHVREYDPGELARTLRRSFESVSVWVSEPRWLLWAYSRRPLRLLINVASIVGVNPFRLFQATPAPRRRGWLGLYAVASGGRKPSPHPGREVRRSSAT